MILLSVEINFLILKVIGVIATGMMLSVTLSICGIFALIYMIIFKIMSRSYRKIVQKDRTNVKKNNTIGLLE